MDRIAIGLVGDNTTPQANDLAQRIAENQVAIQQIRAARIAVFEPHSTRDGTVTPVRPADASKMIEYLRRLDRYERRALSARSRAASDFDRD